MKVKFAPFHVFTSILLTLLCVSGLRAEEAKRGRTADGQAYRVDDQGNQLVDYIAELEVNVDSLTRQLQGLEDENRAKQVIIERLQSGQAAEREITEKNISAQNKLQNSINDCSELVKKETARCAQAIEDVKIDKDLLLQKQTAEVESMRVALKESEAQLQQSREENEINKGKLALADIRADDAEAKRAQVEVAQVKENKTDADKSANVERASIKLDGAASADSRSSNAALSQTRIQAVDILRGRMMNDINSLQGLIAYRDRLYKDARKRSSDLKPLSETEASLARIKKKIENASHVMDLSVLRTEVNELRGRVQGEIAVLTRLQKTR